ncbi:unnamed protein product [Cylindrotheca closterium]|uniref:PH domain-containing protein n=1 Tax=Cylindrotheca closterium TaxID=2856 RepID=A0AAD2JIP8_9STRA|nr:unnamed protein product [Cylindrotheca closterium]
MAMEDADLSREIPVTPVRSSSDNSGLASNYSETASSSVTGPHGANDSIASGIVPPSPQRSYQGTLPPSVTSSPVSVARSTANTAKMSPPDGRNKTPLLPKSGSKVPMQPDLQTPTFNDADVEVADLLGDYSNAPSNHRHQHYSSTPEPRVLYTSDDEETDPTSSITADYPAYARNNATSTFGKVIQPLKDKMNSSKNRSNSEEEGEKNIPPGAIIFGYLQKQGRNGKWQTRWFESDGECLAYYKSSKRVKLLATLDLAKVGYILVNNQDPTGCTFTINIKNRPYFLRSDSKVSCNDWVITLNRIKEARLRQGNVKLVNSQPPDLLDSEVAPRVVVVAGRQRTHAIDDDDAFQWEGNSWNDNPAAHEEYIYDPTNSSAKWQKSAHKLSKFAGKVLRWARSIGRRTSGHGCTAADEQVVLDHHVHPPGHDDGKRSGRSKKPIVNKTPHYQGQNINSKPENDSLTLGRSMSIEDARELS